MGRGNERFGKKEVRARKEKKRKDKEQKKIERKQTTRDGNNLDDMIAYVDEFGNITAEPPDLTQKKVIKAEDIEIGVSKSDMPEVNEKIRNGIVSFFDQTKGFGFIKDLSSHRDVYFHVNELIEPVKENNKVTFEVIKGFKGPKAINIKLGK